MARLLRSSQAKFTVLDLTQRTDLREAVKELTPSVPCLFVEGTLVGDLQTITQLTESGELAKRLPADCVVESLESRLKRLITSHKVMLFMKGSPSEAACGFSSRIVNLLANYPQIKYGSFDIFSDAVVREGLKKYSNWPTYPQLYVDGALVGGIDICLELHEAGELEEALLGKQQ